MRLSHPVVTHRDVQAALLRPLQEILIQEQAVGRHLVMEAVGLGRVAIADDVPDEILPQQRLPPEKDDAAVRPRGARPDSPLRRRQRHIVRIRRLVAIPASHVATFGEVEG